LIHLNRYLQGLTLVVGLGAAACGGGGEDPVGTSSISGSGTGGGAGGAGGEGSAGGAGGAGGGQVLPSPAENLGRDILHTALSVDLATMRATATITLAPSNGTAASFEAAGLSIDAVKSAAGPLLFAVNGGRLDVGVPAGDVPATVIIDYGFEQQKLFEGLMSNGATLVWPYFCGNLFPCHSDPADGTTFSLDVKGTPAGSTTVFAPSIAVSAPSYQVAWATGEYTSLDLGTTAGGTHLTTYYLAGGMAAAQKGSASLRDIFQWYETTYGPYPFGKEAGAVSVKWGPGAYGGMEHHPLFHIGEIAMGDPWILAHEAAHGWYGDGVRIACWEDLVLSEGTVSYLEARAITAILGAAEGQKLWAHYQARLNPVAATIAWPDGCGTIDVLKDLFGDAPYIKGAYFFRALEGKIGVSALDAVLAKFFEQRKGQAARFSDLLELVKAESGYDAAGCAASWLKSATVPIEAACP
jgi:aminopeptidase N